MYANSFFPFITLPTRLTSHSATLIDNILTNSGQICFQWIDPVRYIRSFTYFFAIIYDNALQDTDEMSHAVFRIIPVFLKKFSDTL